MKKLALIGGGSVRTYYFVESLLKFHIKLEIDSIYIMDNDPLKLKYFGGFAVYLAKKAGSSLNVILTDVLEDAVKDADYVVTTLRVGNDAARCFDERTALNLGLIGQETTGAGGFAYAIRTIPSILHCMEVIRKYAKKDSIVFNFTNPSGLITQAIYDAGYENVIGICDNATGIKIDISDTLKINARDIYVKVYGLNHLSWADSVEIGGVNVLPKLMKSEAFIKNFHQFRYFDRSLIRHLGEIPNGYLYYYYHRERALNNMLSASLSRGEQIHYINEEMMSKLIKHDIEKEPEECLKIYQDYMHRREGSYMSIELGNQESFQEEIDIKSLGIPELLGESSFNEIYEGYAGVVFNYIDSVNYNKGIDLAINVENNGAVSGLSNDDVVEVTCEIKSDGAHPLIFKDIPESNLLLMKVIKRYEKLTIEAVKNKSKELAVEALTLHPLVSDYSLAVKLVEAYASQNQAYVTLE